MQLILADQKVLERSLKLQSESCLGDSGICARKSWLEFMSGAVPAALAGFVVIYFTA